MQAAVAAEVGPHLLLEALVVLEVAAMVEPALLSYPVATEQQILVVEAVGEPEAATVMEEMAAPAS